MKNSNRKERNKTKRTLFQTTFLRDSPNLNNKSFQHSERISFNTLFKQIIKIDCIFKYIFTVSNRDQNDTLNAKGESSLFH